MEMHINVFIGEGKDAGKMQGGGTGNPKTKEPLRGIPIIQSIRGITSNPSGKYHDAITNSSEEE